MAGDHLEVVEAGPLTTVQDRGRPGHAHEGVPPSGAADRPAHDLANRLVGNRPDAATLEATLGGLVVRLVGDRARHVAAAGAPAPLLVDRRPVAAPGPAAVRPGQTVTLGTPAVGLRTYLAVAGGVEAAAELGSRSTDLLSGLGPAPLRPGDRLPLGAPGPAPAVDAVPVRPPSGHPVLDFTPGPRDDWLDDGARSALEAAEWVVAPASNRVGLRLQGPDLRGGDRRELPPEGMVTGSIQVPAAGRPIVFLADHPVTGGYPVVGVLTDRAVAVAAQARPGDTLRLRSVPSPGLAYARRRP